MTTVRLPSCSTRFAATAFCAALCLLSFSAWAQQDPRLAKARANANGKVSWYTAIAPDEILKELVDGFKQKTGLDVAVYYAGSGQVVSRLTTERKTKSYGVDVVTLGDLDLVDQLQRDKALRPYTPKDASALQNDYVDKAADWYGVCYWTLAITYNSRQLGKDGAPKSWAELADPKWKGKLVIGDPSRGAGGYLFLKAMVADQGWGWVQKVVANDPFFSPLAPGIDQAVANGERLVGASVSSYASAVMHDKGAEGVASVESLLASPMTASMVVDAPNPEGGELFVDYLLTKEAARVYAKYGWFSTRNDDTPAPYGFDDPAVRKLKYSRVPSTLSRQEYLDKFNAIVQAAKK